MAALLGIPHTVLDHRDDFRRVVVAPFAQSYLEGTTPNPCVACNRNFKIEKLLAWAEDRGIPHVATGHYARIGRRCGNASLLRGSDRNKDQSYFLFALSRRQLERTLFPLGELHKEAVRAKARELGLPVAERPESQDICLEDHRAVVESLARADQLGSGEIVDSRGNVLGHHGGVHGFTVGQRRGLGIAAPRPLYVLRIDAERRRVVVGTREELSTPSFTASRLNWLEPLGEETAAEVQVRYRSKPVPCTLRLLDGQAVEVRPDEPLPSVTPGRPRCSTATTRCWAAAGSTRQESSLRPPLPPWEGQRLRLPLPPGEGQSVRPPLPPWEEQRLRLPLPPGAGQSVRPPLPLGEGWGEGPASSHACSHQDTGLQDQPV